MAAIQNSGRKFVPRHMMMSLGNPPRNRNRAEEIKIEIANSILLESPGIAKIRDKPKPVELSLLNYESISEISEEVKSSRSEFNEKIEYIMNSHADDIKAVEKFVKANDNDFYDYRKEFKGIKKDKRNSRVKQVDLSKIRFRNSTRLVRQVKTEPSSPAKQELNIMGYEFNLEYDGTYISIFNFLSNHRQTLTLKEFFIKIETYFYLFHKNTNISLEELTVRFKNLIGFSTFPYKDLINKVFLNNMSLLNTNVKVSQLYAYVQTNYRDKDFKRLRALKNCLDKFSQSQGPMDHSRGQERLPELGMIVRRRNIALDIPVNLLTVQDKNLSKLQMHFRREAASRRFHPTQLSQQKPPTITECLKTLYSIFLRLMDDFYDKKSNSIHTYIEKIDKQLAQVDHLSVELYEKLKQQVQSKIFDPRLVSPKPSMFKAGNLSLMSTNITKFNKILNRNYGVLSESCQSYLKNFKRTTDLN